MRFCYRHAIIAPSDVERETLRTSAGFANLPGRLGGRCLVHVEQHHARPLARIAERDGAPDAEPAPVMTAMWFSRRGMAFPLLLVLPAL